MTLYLAFKIYGVQEIQTLILISRGDYFLFFDYIVVFHIIIIESYISLLNGYINSVPSAIQSLITGIYSQ
jgi:hypothetical protein